MQKDNANLDRKASLRFNLLKKIRNPIVLETHAGLGKIWERVYSELPTGIAMEADPAKVDALAMQRPTWAVYETECEPALEAGAAAHLAVNLLDLNPDGEPWPAIQAFFGSARPFPLRLGIAVNDGLRHKLKMSGGWSCDSMHPAVAQFGNGYIYRHYLEVARWNLARLAAPRGYELVEWTGYHCGHSDVMSHYAAVLVRPGRA